MRVGVILFYKVRRLVLVIMIPHMIKNRYTRIMIRSNKLIIKSRYNCYSYRIVNIAIIIILVITMLKFNINKIALTILVSIMMTTTIKTFCCLMWNK